MYWHERAMAAESYFERLTFERDELREALREYAHHKPSCSGKILEDCDCGLVAILAAGGVT
jgi:hypothetical protein